MNQASGPQSLTYQIVEDLGASIVSGRFSADQGAIPETELCARYGASRSILREAVKMLAAKGLISSRPRHGTRAAPESGWNLLDPDVLRWLLQRDFSEELLIDFTQMRLAMEPAAAELAAQNGTGEQKAVISAALADMAQAAARGGDVLSADIAFHEAVLSATGNRMFVQLRPMIGTALKFSIRRTNSFKRDLRQTVREHAAVGAAIEAGDGARARAAMEVVIREALDLMLASRAHDDRPAAAARTRIR